MNIMMFQVNSNTVRGSITLNLDKKSSIGCLINSKCEKSLIASKFNCERFLKLE